MIKKTARGSILYVFLILSLSSVCLFSTGIHAAEPARYPPTPVSFYFSQEHQSIPDPLILSWREYQTCFSEWETQGNVEALKKGIDRFRLALIDYRHSDSFSLQRTQDDGFRTFAYALDSFLWDFRSSLDQSASRESLFSSELRINQLMNQYLSARLSMATAKSRQYVVLLSFFVLLIAFIVLIILLFRSRLSLSLQSEAVTARFARSMIHAQEAERVALARELHDTLAQDLLYIRLKTDTLGRLISSSGASGIPAGQISAELASIVALESRSVEQIREVCQELRPPELEHLGLKAAIADLCGKFRDQTGLVCHFLVSGDIVLPNDKGINCYRIIQESLNNVRKHSGATEVLVQLTLIGDSRLSILVEDNGSGIGRRFLDGGLSGRYGIKGMKERAKLMNGELEIVNKIEGGTSVSVTIPLYNSKK
ncbi:MAG: sensor histidine kinase [Spirochaetales bacterium]|nr:sensor histidine kinase [Spirochaetales bacterium]